MVARIVVVHSPAPQSLEPAAQAVAEVLARTGVMVEVRSTRDVESLREFDSAVICGQIGHSGWRDEAVAFIGLHRRELAQMSVAFCVGLSPEMDARDAVAIQRALKWPMDWYNEVRPVKVGLFHLNHTSAPDEIRRWAERLKPNFIAPSLESPAGTRPFIESHPAETHDQSTLPVTGYSAGERKIMRGEAPEGPPTPYSGERSPGL